MKTEAARSSNTPDHLTTVRCADPQKIIVWFTEITFNSSVP